MIPYELYKWLHIISITFLTLLVGITFTHDKESTPKIVKILTGIFSFLIFLGGMGLMARLGISHKEGWPTWIIIKVVLWLALAIGVPVLSKRVLGPTRAKIPYPIMGLVMLAAYIAIYKPF